jgi:hypothetical protein
MKFGEKCKDGKGRGSNSQFRLIAKTINNRGPSVKKNEVSSRRAPSSFFSLTPATDA